MKPHRKGKNRKSKIPWPVALFYRLSQHAGKRGCLETTYVPAKHWDNSHMVAKVLPIQNAGLHYRMRGGVFQFTRPRFQEQGASANKMPSKWD